MIKNYLTFVVGATNVGKSTTLQAFLKAFPEETHLIEVGKMLRAKYPPEYFEGQGAPAKTQVEALSMLFDGIEAADKAKKRFVFVDGQPRDVEQAVAIQRYKGNLERTRTCLHLVCPREVRVARAQARDTGKALELSMARMDADILKIHEVLIAFDECHYERWNTNHRHYDPAAYWRVFTKVQETQP